MELSSEVLDTIGITDDKDVMEVLKQAVTEEDIIFESEATEDSIDTEVEEIIEIIEEVEESEESLHDYDSNSCSQDKETKSVDDDNYDENSQQDQFDKNLSAEVYSFSDNFPKNNTKQVVTYNVDEDWQDDEAEHIEEMNEDAQHELGNEDIEMIEKRAESSENVSMDDETEEYSLQSNRSQFESTQRIDKSRTLHDLGNNFSSIKHAEKNNSHEIVKNTENNLVYTVLQSKKQNTKDDKFTDAHYIKMEQLDENTIPVEGTIYYEGENMETLYVAQAVDNNDQYQYDTDTQQAQVWDESNADMNQNPEEETSQDQIFLHEDEDGQLYFKDDSGALQLVYLTKDGNYAIAENSDDQDSKESESQTQETSRGTEDGSFIIPDLELKSSVQMSKQTAIVPASSLHELDNEDNTVTISLIISEDEHGQKRTQVIIPTTDNMKCDICNKSFKTSFQLLRHNRLKHAREEDITTRNFPCDLCPKRYPDQNSLARHRKTHTGDRPFQCLECHKTFPTSTALRRHLTLHNSQSRPLPCIYCGRRFLEKSSLAKHEQSHLPADQRSHTCDVCHKSFLHATDLSLHKKYHDPDKKFDCEVCGREFNRLNNLQRHMMVHQQQGANEEILACDVCGITYKFMSSLTRHMVTTHMNPEKLRQQAEEQRRKREHNYRRYLENRKMYETQNSGGYGTKRSYHHSARILAGSNDEVA